MKKEDFIKLYKKLRYSKWINFLFPLSSIIIFVLLGILMRYSLLNNRPIVLKEWLIFMTMYFAVLILPYDIMRWFIWGKKKYAKKVSSKNTKNILHDKAKIGTTENAKHSNPQATMISSNSIKKYQIKERVSESLMCASIREEELSTALKGNEYLKKEDPEVFDENKVFNDITEKKESISVNPIYSETEFDLFDRILIATNYMKETKELDSLFIEAGRFIIEKNKASIGMLQRWFKIGFNRAARIMDQLAEAGIVGEEQGTHPRKIYVTAEEFELILDNLNASKSSLFGSENEEASSINYDTMTGSQFESFCSFLLISNNFKNVEVTKGSGDHGIDILAEKDDITYAIQCKCYSGNVGNDAIQQALAGKKFYKRDIAVVLTNQYFTQQAQEEAAVFGVKLWDRDKLDELIQNINK